MKLNLGCCDERIDGFIGVDICEPADVIADLRERWPWDDSSVDEIRAFDILEHLPDKLHSLNEAWRVLKPGGRFNIEVPTTDGRGAWQDLQHVSYWNRNSFWYVTEGNSCHRRFAGHYGIKATFRVVSEKHANLADNIVKLRIVLEAVK